VRRLRNNNIFEHAIPRTARRRPAWQTAGSAMHILRESAEIRGTHHRARRRARCDAIKSDGKHYQINQNMNRKAD
jgi:hypothetical protein